MPLPQGFGNNDVEGTAECFCLREAENSGGAAVPQANHPLGIRIDDRIRHARNETVGELRWVNLHGSSQRTLTGIRDDGPAESPWCRAAEIVRRHQYYSKPCTRCFLAKLC